MRAARDRNRRGHLDMGGGGGEDRRCHAGCAECMESKLLLQGSSEIIIEYPHDNINVGVERARFKRNLQGSGCHFGCTA